MGFDLAGKTVLLTGASSGIGWGLAKAFAGAGAKLALSARREDALTQLALQIRLAGGEAEVLPADLSHPGAAADLADRTRRVFGHVDVLVNNAGVGMAAAQWVGGDGAVARALHETNYWSAVALAGELVPEMTTLGSGAVVNVASMSAVLPFPMTGHYAASKSALAAATDALRMELRGTGVGVMLVLPGPVETAMLAEARQIDGFDHALSLTRPGNVETLARLVVQGIERGRREIVYPRSLWLTRFFPTFGHWAARWLSRNVRPDVHRLVAGGSTGGSEAREARERFDALHAKDRVCGFVRGAGDRVRGVWRRQGGLRLRRHARRRRLQ
jgi:uncharacterized protein